MLIKLSKYSLLYLLTLLIVALLSLPIIFDLLFAAALVFFFRKNIYSLVVTNSLIIISVIFLNIIYKNNQEKIDFYRAHEKYQTSSGYYEKNINDRILMPYGDLFVLDECTDKKDKLAEPRVQNFITDNFGIRNNIITIKDAQIILVGDSLIAGTSETQENIPANILNNISNYKIASLSMGGGDPNDYERMIKDHLNFLNKDVQIIVFYFSGNDFKEITKKNENFINWRGYEVNKIKYKIRFSYERLERNKSKYLLSTYGSKNYFFKNIRFRSQKFIRSYLNKFTNTCGVDYHLINNERLGFYWKNSNNMDTEYSTYIFKDKDILSKISKIVFIPTKEEVYNNYLTKDKIILNKRKFDYLKNNYQKLGFQVYDLTGVMQKSAKLMLLENKFLFWKDDTHWNKNGIVEAMSYIESHLIK